MVVSEDNRRRRRTFSAQVFDEMRDALAPLNAMQAHLHMQLD